MQVSSMRGATLLCAMAAGLYGAEARATHPDYEGEKGLELQLMPAGVGGAFTHDESVFLSGNDLPRPEVSAPYDSFGPSYGVNLAVGWRFHPAVSAGLLGGYQALSSAQTFSSQEAMFVPTDVLRSFRAGAYARVYPMAFFNGSLHNPRVMFQSWTDRRRFEPWLSLGVEFANYQRDRSYNDVSRLDSYAQWRTSYVGVPIGIGAEYRVLQSLAVGLSFIVSPLVGGGTSRVVHTRILTPGSDVTTHTETSYDPGAASNVSWFASLSVRYTFTFGGGE